MSGFSGNSEPTVHTARVDAAEGCRKYLAAIIRVALKNDFTPPGLSAAETIRLAESLNLIRPTQQRAYVRKHAGTSKNSITRRKVTPLHDEVAKAEFEAVAAQHGLTVDEIIGPSRYAHLIAARRDVVARLQGRYSLALIGRWMGNRDHSTIIAYTKKAA